MWPDLDTNNQRLQCIGHMINLIPKTFLFGNRSKTFEADIIVVDNISNLEKVIKLWKKQWVIGKLYNLLQFI